MTSSFKVTTVILLSLFIMPKQGIGRLVKLNVEQYISDARLVMDPDEEYIVLDQGKTLKLTCTYNMPVNFNHGFNISWKLPDHLDTNKLVGNMRYLQLRVIKTN